MTILAQEKVRVLCLPRGRRYAQSRTPSARWTGFAGSRRGVPPAARLRLPPTAPPSATLQVPSLDGHEPPHRGDTKTAALRPSRKGAFSFRRRCASTFSKKSKNAFRASRSFSTVLPPFRRNMSKSSTKTAARSRRRSVFRKNSSARRLLSALTRLTSTPTDVSR